MAIIVNDRASNPQVVNGDLLVQLQSVQKPVPFNRLPVGQYIGYKNQWVPVAPVVNIEQGADATVILKDTAGNTILTTTIASGEAGEITAPDGNVENTDASYTATVRSDGTLVIPDYTLTINDTTSGNTLFSGAKKSAVNITQSVTCPTLAQQIATESVNDIVSAIQAAGKACGVLGGLEAEYAPIVTTTAPFAVKWNPNTREYYVVEYLVGVKIFNEDKTLNRGFANAGIFSLAFNEDYSLYAVLEIGTTTIYNTADDTVAGTISAGFGGVGFKNGNVYLDNGLTSVFEYTVAGTLVDTISVAGVGISRVRALTSDYDNNRLYVGGDNGNVNTGGRLGWIDLTTHAVTAISIPAMGSVTSIVIDSSYNLWITVDTNSNLIYNLQNDGTLIASYPYIYRDANSRQTIDIREDMSCTPVLLIPNPHTNVDRVEFFRP